MGRKYPECPFHANRCFAHTLRSGSCKALENTDFDLWKGCPFYKEKSKVKQSDLPEEEDEEMKITDGEGEVIVRLAE